MAIRISKKCYYALRAVFELAQRHTDVPVTVAEIASTQGMPPRFLEGILNELRHARLVRSHRGNAGGYTLALPPSEITVADVVQVSQGPFSLVAGRGTKSIGNKYFCGDWAFEEFWKTVDESMARICRETTLADLLRLEKASAQSSIPDYAI
jgi:Rrf2 family protein